jgi:hypothetical protein
MLCHGKQVACTYVALFQAIVIKPKTFACALLLLDTGKGAEGAHTPACPLSNQLPLQGPQLLRL